MRQMSGVWKEKCLVEALYETKEEGMERELSRRSGL